MDQNSESFNVRVKDEPLDEAISENPQAIAVTSNLEPDDLRKQSTAGQAARVVRSHAETIPHRPLTDYDIKPEPMDASENHDSVPITVKTERVLGDDDATPPRAQVEDELLTSELITTRLANDFPPGFFDDLLDERIVKSEIINTGNIADSNAHTNEQSTTAPENGAGDNIEETEPEVKRKKHKKDKKKKKRRRRSSSEGEHFTDVKRECLSPDGASSSSYSRQQRRRSSAIKERPESRSEEVERHQQQRNDAQAGSSNNNRPSYQQSEASESSHRATAPRPTLKIRAMHNLLPAQKEVRAEKIVTPKMRKQNAMKKAADAIKFLQLTTIDLTQLEVGFQYARTICKLPNKMNFMSQQFFEYHSPLCNNNNVVYKFNSTKGQIDLSNWGLVSLSDYPAKICRVIGFDYEKIRKKLETINMPPKLLKLKEFERGIAEEELKTAGIGQTSCLYNTTSTQTDNVVCLSSNAHEPKPTVEQAGTQTDPEKPDRGTLDLRKRAMQDVNLIYLVLDALDNPPRTAAQQNEVVIKMSETFRNALANASR